MAAEGLPAGGPPAAPPGWELDAWYQDLQEVLAAAEPGGPAPPWGAEQAPLWSSEGPGGVPELDAALAAELLELLGPESPAGPEPLGPPCAPPGSPQPAEGSAGRGVKRKRCGAAGGAPREPERVPEQRVLELTAQNERLREEIGRLSAEVQRTRAALIDRILGLRQA
ncbi:DNA damage-inducible transcript 3 protein [Aegotheles albertisi]